MARSVDDPLQAPRTHRRSPILRYGVAALLILGCAVPWALVAPHVEFEVTLLLFVVPVLLATGFGGRGPGVLATALALASALYLMPFERSTGGARGDYLDLLLFATEAAVIVVLTTALQRARDAADAANQSKETFIAIVSHELRGPLNVVSGSVPLLRRMVGNPHALHRGLDRIERATRIQTRLIDDLLDVSRALAGKLTLDCEPTPLTAILSSAVEDVRARADEKHIEISAEVDTTAIVDADPVRLAQIFTNLLTNAVKFTPDGGRIEVGTAVTGEHVRVTVRDTGPGIAPRVLPFVFDPFRQADGPRDAKAGGLGLGLAVARHLVLLHGGHIGVESSDRTQGTRFIVDLKVIGEHAEAARVRQANRAAAN
jgi:signal transduction histidine kinase